MCYGLYCYSLVTPDVIGREALTSCPRRAWPHRIAEATLRDHACITSPLVLAEDVFQLRRRLLGHGFFVGAHMRLRHRLVIELAGNYECLGNNIL